MGLLRGGCDDVGSLTEGGEVGVEGAGRARACDGATGGAVCEGCEYNTAG